MLQMFESFGPDIKLTLPCELPTIKSAQSQTELICVRLADVRGTL